MSYNIKNSGYLGTVKDMSSHILHGFQVNNQIHLIYDLNNPQPSIKNIEDIKKDMDKYLWTPYSLFVDKLTDTPK